ncbi:molybdopterin biosynthesis protein [Desulfonatronovibrio hydrogenovorans]|uniref:molybdopterin biosynthesis protein n=1 Tax=Desulfonatronovibrio hydrogenovorans TaxID=53245 RepID=UPI00049149EC|nr:molybdopterin biosynthesis protein [Desulfonatronovibrio hydrogenovorans]
MEFKRNIYLQTMTIEEALDKVKLAIVREEKIQAESIPTHEAVQRVTAAPVWARYSSPTFHSAAMDGVAVKAESTFKAREGSPVRLLKDRDFIEVNTGNPLPLDMDSVIMVEKIVQQDQESILIESPVFPWQNVRRVGEDIVATELLLPQNHQLSAYDIGALLSAGIWEISVRPKVHIHVIPTGDEVLDFTTRPTPRPGQVIESNSQVLASMAGDWGCDISRTPPVPDDPEKLSSALEKALESSAQIIVIGAGSSAGSRDFTKKIMEQAGQVLVHGIKAMPGKPTMIGMARGKIVIGAPGYPVSSVVCYEQILKPLVCLLSGRSQKEPETVEARLTRKVPSRLGMEEFLRLSVGRVKDGYVATPLARGAGMITTLTRAQGFTRIDQDLEGLARDKVIRVELLRPKKELDQVLVAVGSHDNLLDLLANELMGREEPIHLASTHLGSMGGITAIKDQAAHMAGIHLFDPETSDYNFPFLNKYGPELNFRLINLAIRHQGLMVAPGNPKNIHSIQDLTRDDVTFINRQKGAGTRILLDHHLKKDQVRAMDIKGYDQEEFTHMAVAVNVLSKTADCGLGIMAAAKALGLDFVPLARERYDLLIPDYSFSDPKIQALLELLALKKIKDMIAAQGGYEVHFTGQEMKPGQGI